MEVTTPKKPEETNPSLLVESNIGSLALSGEIDKDRQRREILGRQAARRILGSAMAVTSVVLVSAALANSSESSQPTGTPDCGWNQLNGTEVLCEDTVIPPTCAPAVQLRQFRFQPRKLASVSRLPEIEQTKEELDLPEHMSIGIEDPGAVIDNYHGRAEAILYLGRLAGATKFRMLVYPDKFQNRRKKIRAFERAKYDAAVDRAIACGYDVEITLAGNAYKWTVTKWRNFVKRVGLRYKDKVDDWALINEPNLNFKGTEYWLEPIHYRGRKLTLPQTARLLFQRGQQELLGINPENKVDLGGLNYERWPLRFWSNLLKPLPWEKGNTTIMINNFRFHPYRKYGSRTKNKPIVFDSNKDPMAETISIENHEVIANEVHRAFEEGLVETPEGKEPRILYDEFNEFERANMGRKKRNIRPNIRAINAAKILNVLCSDERVAGINFYILDALPKWRKKFDSFDTSMINLHGKIDRVLYAISSWKSKNPSCLEK